ncbi:hypothetical protein TSUD_356140 [Trifolium subterraneum]|uniref:Uncharacterized protein n=1 Tax=Trifolium subterraneum TaxID=3900 RepID=A0A2Z6LXZ8_TRISU|nr:hypothetical protein TSUD_356140 [Trifolium subterraneum]
MTFDVAPLTTAKKRFVCQGVELIVQGVVQIEIRHWNWVKPEYSRLSAGQEFVFGQYQLKVPE